MTLSFDDYRSYDALGLASLIRRGEVSRDDVLQASLARIAEANPVVNAVTYLHDRFDDADTSSDAPFAGVPYLIKDLHAPVKDMPLTHGSRLFKGDVKSFDSETVARLRKAGFVILGRTASPEFGISASTEPALTGLTRNPWNLKHTAGGSSGGSGAAVASGMLPAAHATDSGGSIRIPAACNGLVGLKPTRGLIPTGPHRGEASHGISHEHAVTRSVRDCAAILDATAGRDVGAPYFTEPVSGGYIKAIDRPPRPLRVAFTTSRFDGKPVDEECRKAVIDTVKLLEAMGHQVEERIPEFNPSALGAACGVLLLTGLTANIEARLAELKRELRDDDIESVTREAIMVGRKVTGVQYASQFAVLNREVRSIAKFFEGADGFDLLVTPTLGKPPILLGELSMQTLSMDEFKARLDAFCPFTGAFNATGQPAISLPLHWSEAGLPVGVQFVGRFGDDATLLQLSAQIEVAKPWFLKMAKLPA